MEECHEKTFKRDVPFQTGMRIAFSSLDFTSNNGNVWGFYLISETNPFERVCWDANVIYLSSPWRNKPKLFWGEKEKKSWNPTSINPRLLFWFTKEKLNRYHFSNKTLVLISLSLSLLCQFTRMEGATQHRSDGMSPHSTEATSHARKASRLWTVSCLSEVCSIWHNNCCSVTMKSFYQVVEYFGVGYSLASRFKKKKTTKQNK